MLPSGLAQIGKAKLDWRVRCIAPRNHFVIQRPETRTPAFFVPPLAGYSLGRTPPQGNCSPLPLSRASGIEQFQ
jgi:hypothetical protein